MLALADGTFFPPCCYAIPWGRAGRPAGLAPEALQECGTPPRFYSHCSLCARHLFQPASELFQSASAAPYACIDVACVRCMSRRCSLASSPLASAHSRRSGRALLLFYTSPRRPSAGLGARCLRLPSSGLRIAGSLSSCYWVVQVDAHAPFDKGRLVVRRLVHESAHAGMLGWARSCSLGTEGAEALAWWDPSTSCPRWLLNTTCGAPSSWWSLG
jgi:hypothetical protein